MEMLTEVAIVFGIICLVGFFSYHYYMSGKEKS